MVSLGLSSVVEPRKPLEANTVFRSGEGKNAAMFRSQIARLKAVGEGRWRDGTRADCWSAI